MFEAFTKMMAGIAFLVLVSLMVGWLIAIMWNYFPFLNSLVHLDWWDGTVLYLLTGTLFRGSAQISS